MSTYMYNRFDTKSKKKHGTTNWLSEHFAPAQPATQRHCPVFASHSALFWQSQLCWHPAPYLPGGQAATETDQNIIKWLANSVGTENLPWWQLLLGHPYGSTGGLLFCSWCFFSTRNLRDPSADRQETLPHDGNMCQFYNASPKIRGGALPKKIRGQKHAKFR